MMQEPHDYRALIAQIAPELDVRQVRAANGQFNDVIIANEAWVFRFPRSAASAASAATLRAEVVTLRALAGRLPLPIPAPVYTSNEASSTYMGYRLLPGEALDRADVAALPDDALERIARQLADFLGVLHQLPLSLLPPGTPIQDTRDEWEELFAGFREQLFPYMRRDARDTVTRDFSAFLDAPLRDAWTPVIRHGDLGSGNVLYDAESGALTGVIDFASAGVGDPAIDLAALMSWGDRLLAQVLVAWPAAQSLLARAQFYRSTFLLQEAYYGLRDGDQESFESGIAPYR
jgi:aminoglycoside 2''-phosphotransferase